MRGRTPSPGRPPSWTSGARPSWSANEELREEIGRLQTDNAYIEHLARTELGLVRPGEIEFMLVPNGRTTPPGGAGAGSDAADPTAGSRRQHPASPRAPAGSTG